MKNNKFLHLIFVILLIWFLTMPFYVLSQDSEAPPEPSGPAEETVEPEPTPEPAPEPAPEPTPSETVPLKLNSSQAANACSIQITSANNFNDSEYHIFSLLDNHLEASSNRFRDPFPENICVLFNEDLSLLPEGEYILIETDELKVISCSELGGEEFTECIRNSPTLSTINFTIRTQPIEESTSSSSGGGGRRSGHGGDSSSSSSVLLNPKIVSRANIHADLSHEEASDNNNDLSDGFEVYFDSDEGSKAVLAIDGDNDSKIDFFIDTNNDSTPDKYWDPDEDVLSDIVLKDVDSDHTLDWTYQSYCYGTVCDRIDDSYYSTRFKRIGQILASDATCTPYLNGSVAMAINRRNDPNEVKKLQSFLAYWDDEYNNEPVEITGVYDRKTLDRVVKFQEKYSAEILQPIKLTKGTGIVASQTKKKINQLYCSISN